ncbi:hypothetical protein CRN67_05690 [Campylobacter blaseri]|uniref:Purine nucleoside phosphorylase n=1 Tax=Campylobacter blaseri TaxID=2042961 RepID=A0A2P8R0T0_9BACT|nr:hypothetical protein CQ405_05690 [Campylobacter blaseri]PSM53876.1 hypothetical protein CRN67_05690 [Campylobacter blaseri]
MKFVLDDENCVAGFTNKFGGVSKGEFSSLNLALHVGDDKDKVLKNREILKNSLGVKKLIFMEQIHSDKVEILRLQNQILNQCDAVITNLKDVALCVMVADCVPVIFVDSEKRCTGVAHCGRVGIVKNLASKTLNLMQSEFSVKNVYIYVGPFIQPRCYEVGALDLNEFNKYKQNGKFDMKGALVDELNALGVENINFLDICTHCSDEYFSYRKDGKTGRFAGFVMLK